ncbi:MAG: Mur ligase family protein, partial [Chloroflexus sp.]
DDEHGRRLVREATADGTPVSTFSATGAGPGAEADWRASEVRADASGSSFVLLGPGGLEVPAGVPLPGAFNVANALAAVAACAEAGYDPVAVAAAVAVGLAVLAFTLNGLPRIAGVALLASYGGYLALMA